MEQEQPLTAAEAAADWLARQRHRLDLADDEPVLWLDQKRWFVWTGRHWAAIPQDQLRAALVRHLAGCVPDRRLTPRFVEQVTMHLGAACLRPAPDTLVPLDAGPGTAPSSGRFIAFDDGVLDLDDPATLHPLTSRCFTTVTMPFVYDPQARCPRWRQFLDEMLPPREEHWPEWCRPPAPVSFEPEPPAPVTGGPIIVADHRQQLLRQFMFESLAGRPRSGRMLIMAGTADGANGKGVVTRVWQALLGASNVATLSLSALDDARALPLLASRRVNFADGFGPLARLNRSRLLQWIDGQPLHLTAGSDPMRQVQPLALPVVTCNELPELSVADGRWWRRTVVVPFFRVVRAQQRDERLAERIIAEELPGVLNWVMEAAADDAGDDGPTRCEHCERYAAAHWSGTDPLAQFLDECCHVGLTAGVKMVRRDVLYEAYRVFCRKLGPGMRPLSRAGFGQRLRGYGVSDYRHPGLPDGRRPRYYTRIALRREGLGLLPAELAVAADDGSPADAGT